MRRTLVPFLLAALVAAAVAVPALAATRTVRVGDNWFVRSSGVPTVTVGKGDRVRFRFVGRSIHNASVTSGPQRFRSSTKRSGTWTSPRLTRRGTYRVICTIHGSRDQRMTLRVG